MPKLNLKLITPARTLLEQPVDAVTMDTRDGQITVLANHAPLVSILKPGELVVRDQGKETPIACSGGLIEIFANNLVILADSAEHLSEIELEQAEKEADKLIARLQSEEKLDITTYKTLQRQLEREAARINLVKKWKK